MKNFVLKGDICYSKSLTELHSQENAYLLCIDGKSAGVFDVLPVQYQDLPLLDYSDHLIIPGLVDLHLHAPQLPYRALGMDLELIDWLNAYTFPEEARYDDLDYAKEAYGQFVGELQAGPNTRGVIFATRHVEATILLMDLLEASGLSTMVGKVNMDRNTPDPLCEGSASQSLADTKRWLETVGGRYINTQPILTPRFVPSCSDALLAGLGEIAREFSLPVQSHLSENKGEIAWVQGLVPDAPSYGHAYHKHGLFGGAVPTVMAHCVWPSDIEFSLMQEQGVWVAHCPQSNINLSSGIAPVRKFLEGGVPVGLGSDVAGGVHTSIFRAIVDAIGVSKLYWRLVDQGAKPLSLEEGFYLATLGGGSFFGTVGSFEAGYALDALVIADKTLRTVQTKTLQDRLAKVIYLSENRHIKEKFVAGKKLERVYV